MKSIFGYRSYRDFLKDAYQYHKQQNSRFSFASFSKKAGLASPNYLKLVMDGDRILTTGNIQAFATALDLGLLETNFFEALVLENQAKQKLEKRFYANRLNQLRKASGKSSYVRQKPSALLKSAMKTALLVLGNRREPLDLLERAQAELNLSQKQVETLISEMSKSGHIRLNEQNCYEIPNRHTMMSDPKGFSDSQKQFLSEGLHESLDVFQQRYPTGRAKFLSLILSANEESLNALFRDLRLAVEAVVQKYEPPIEQDKAVYRVQLQTYRIRKDAL